MEFSGQGLKGVEPGVLPWARSNITGNFMYVYRGQAGLIV